MAKKGLMFSLIAFSFALPIKVNADQPVNMIRVLCMPDEKLAHFSVEVTQLNEVADYIAALDTGKPDTSERKEEQIQRIANLQKYGLLLPREYSFECMLPRHTYSIAGTKPPHREQGMCGGNPRITLTLKKSDQILLRDVFVSPSCFKDEEGGYVSKIVIDELGLSYASVTSGKKTQNLLLDSQYRKAQPVFPVTQDYLNCVIKNGFLDSQTAGAYQDSSFHKQCANKTQ